jgi:tetratricopeptide (TPR) repeat protein
MIGALHHGDPAGGVSVSAEIASSSAGPGPGDGPGPGNGADADADIDSLFLSFCLSDSDRLRAVLAAEVLAHPDLASFVAERKDAPESREHVLRLARYDVMREIERDEDWIGTATAWLVKLNASWSESADYCNKLCRRSRDQRNTPRPYLKSDEIQHADPADVTARARLHLFLTALRYEFRCRAIEHFVESMVRPPSALDPYVHAVYAFALLAQNKPEGVEEMNAVLARGDSDDASVLHALQEGLRFAEEVPGQAEMMLTLWRRPPFTDRRDSTVLLREAFALRKLGRYDEALTTIDRSLMLLQPNEVDRYANRMSERWRILEQRDLAQRIEREYAKAHEDARAEVEETSRRLLAQIEEEVSGVRRQVADSLFRVVEIIGIFTAVIALVIGGAAAGNSDQIEWWQRAVLIAVSGVVAIGFFVLLRFVVRPGGGPPGRRQ